MTGRQRRDVFEKKEGGFIGLLLRGGGGGGGGCGPRGTHAAQQQRGWPTWPWKSWVNLKLDSGSVVQIAVLRCRQDPKENRRSTPCKGGEGGGSPF
jgi:hypothetical protein